MKVINRAPVAANVAVNTGAAQIFPQNAAPLLAAALQLPGTGRFVNKNWIMKAGGFATTTAATTTAAITLYGIVGNAPVVNPLLAASWTVLATSTARVINTTNAPWFIEAAFFYDSISKKLNGTSTIGINNLVDGRAALAAVLTALDDTQEPVITLALGITFAVNLSATNVGGLSEFILGF